jgi:mono/diheme cytochrome c family protein
MACHGPLGRPTAFNREYKPRNLADPAYMATLTDAYISSVIRNGGIAFNISPAMLAHPSLSNEDVDALVKYIRSLPNER